MSVNKYQEQYNKIQAAAQKQAAALDASMVRNASSFADLRKKGVALYAAWAKEYEEMENAVNSILAERNYSDVYKNERVSHVRAVYEESMEKLKNEFRESVNSTLAAKEAALNKMFSTAPTQEQLNLLQALQLRGNDLSQEEIMRIGCDFAGNYNAMKALQKVAKEAGCNLVLPELYNADVLFERFSWVKNYLEERCRDMGMLWKQMSFDGRCFFGTEWEDMNYNNTAVELFDKHNALSLMGAKLVSDSPNPDAAPLTEDERAFLNAMFGGLHSSKELEKAVLTAVTEDETVTSLIAKHDVYKNFLPNSKS